jgi:hypothetical protein
MGGIRIHGDEFNTADLFTNHASYGIATSATHANNFYLGRAGYITSF